MFTHSGIADLPRYEREAVKTGLSLLFQSGYFQAVIREQEALLLGGDKDEAPNAVAGRIIRFRQDRAILQELIELGQRFNEEQTK